MKEGYFDSSPFYEKNKRKEDEYMKLEFINLKLKSVSDFLYSLELKGRDSRARQKLNKAVVEKLNEFSNDFMELEHDLSGDELTKAKLELASEVAVVDVSEYEGIMNRLYAALINYDKEISGEDADSYDLILDELEKYIEEPTEAPENENKGDDE